MPGLDGKPGKPREKQHRLSPADIQRHRGTERGGQKADDPARQFCVHCGGGTAGCHPQPRNAPGREDHCRCGDR